MSSQLDIFAAPAGPPDYPGPETDCGWLLRLLWEGDWHTLGGILAASFRDRGYGLTVHSRVSDLRKKHGYTVEQRSVPGARRGASSEYRLIR